MILNALETKEDVFNFIAQSTIYGNLGLFVGAGLPMAILNDGYTEIALSWPSLIDRCCVGMEIDYSNIKKDGLSYPEIATAVCKQYVNDKGVNYEEAVKQLKYHISSVTSWYPEKIKRKEYAGYFGSINPKWVITTNYDTIIESILTGKGYSLSPDDYMVAQKDLVPVYHLHGIRTNPDSIIITQEDYVTLFRPNQYRQQKLPLTIKESVTVLIGYNLGDLNVLTAVDWSKNVYSTQTISYPQDIIQFLYCKNPKSKPYRTHNGIVILEFDNLSTTLSDLKVIIDEKVIANRKVIDLALALNSTLIACEEDDVKEFVDNEEFRQNMLKEINEESIYLINGFLEFFNKAIDLTWERARAAGAFFAYEQNLKILMDTLINLNIKKMPPALIEAVVSNLNSVAYYIGSHKGKSNAAYRTWNKERKKISDEAVDEIRNISKSRQYSQVIELITHNEVR